MPHFPDAVLLCIVVGMLAGIGAGALIGIVNGAGVAFVGVSPFMMTLGMASVGFGISLYLTGGVPVYGMPKEFGKVLGFGQLFGILAAPVIVTLALIVVMYFAAELDAHGPLFLCHRRQSQGVDAVRHQYAPLSFPGLRALRHDHGDLPASC